MTRARERKRERAEARGRAIRRTEVDVECLSHKNSNGQRNIYIRPLYCNTGVWNLHNIDKLDMPLIDLLLLKRSSSLLGLGT